MADADLRDKFRWLVASGVLIASLLCIFQSIFIFLNKDLVPFWDMVSVIYFLEGGSTNGIPANWLSTDVFKFVDNEHRPFLPMIIWGLDHDLFGSRGYFPQTLIVVCSLLITLLATQWSGIFKKLSLESLLISMCACALMLSAMHYENLLWPKQIHVYLSVLLSLLAIKAAVSMAESQGIKPVLNSLLVSVLAFGATFSFSYGLVLWPLLVVHGALRRWRPAVQLTILVSAIVTISLYFRGFALNPHHSNPLESIKTPLEMSEYIAKMLGGPFAMFSSDLAVLLGLVSLLVLAAVATKFYLGQKTHGKVFETSLLVCVFLTGVAVMTALGRVSVNDGLDSRYLVISALYCLAFPGLFIGELKKGTAQFEMVITAFSVVVLGLSIVSWESYWLDINNRLLAIKEGAIAAALKTEPMGLGLYPNRVTVNNYVWPTYLSKNSDDPKLAIFNYIGEPLQEFFLENNTFIEQSNCLGKVDFVKVRATHPRFQTFSGWARFANKDNPISSWLLVANQHGNLVGFGAVGTFRPDVSQDLQDSRWTKLIYNSLRSGFLGHVRAEAGDSLEFYAFDDGYACKFSDSYSVNDG